MRSASCSRRPALLLLLLVGSLASFELVAGHLGRGLSRLAHGKRSKCDTCPNGPHAQQVHLAPTIVNNIHVGKAQQAAALLNSKFGLDGHQNNHLNSHQGGHGSISSHGHSGGHHNYEGVSLGHMNGGGHHSGEHHLDYALPSGHVSSHQSLDGLESEIGGHLSNHMGGHVDAGHLGGHGHHGVAGEFVEGLGVANEIAHGFEGGHHGGHVSSHHSGYSGFGHLGSHTGGGQHGLGGVSHRVKDKYRLPGAHSHHNRGYNSADYGSTHHGPDGAAHLNGHWNGGHGGAHGHSSSLPAVEAANLALNRGYSSPNRAHSLSKISRAVFDKHRHGGRDYALPNGHGQVHQQGGHSLVNGHAGHGGHGVASGHGGHYVNHASYNPNGHAGLGGHNAFGGHGVSSGHGAYESHSSYGDHHEYANHGHQHQMGLDGHSMGAIRHDLSGHSGHMHLPANLVHANGGQAHYQGHGQTYGYGNQNQAHHGNSGGQSTSAKLIGALVNKLNKPQCVSNGSSCGLQQQHQVHQGGSGASQIIGDLVSNYAKGRQSGGPRSSKREALGKVIGSIAKQI